MRLQNSLVNEFVFRNSPRALERSPTIVRSPLPAADVAYHTRIGRDHGEAFREQRDGLTARPGSSIGVETFAAKGGRLVPGPGVA